MSIKLANNEQILKEYAYATTTEGLINKRTTNNSLIVTNKRIIKKDICNKTGYEKINVSEIPVSAVTGVDVKMSSSFKFILLLLGIVFAIAGLACMAGIEDSEGAAAIMMILFLAIAVLCIYKFAKTRSNVLVCTFMVADRINAAMFLGKISFHSIFSRFNVSGQSSLIKVVVDANVARDFVNEIGAMLVDIKENAAN